MNTGTVAVIFLAFALVSASTAALVYLGYKMGIEAPHRDKREAQSAQVRQIDIDKEKEALRKTKAEVDAYVQTRNTGAAAVAPKDKVTA
jgi:hypothetical protein